MSFSVELKTKEWPFSLGEKHLNEMSIFFNGCHMQGSC